MKSNVKEYLINSLLELDSLLLRGKLTISEEIAINEERNTLITLIEKLDEKDKK